LSFRSPNRPLKCRTRQLRRATGFDKNTFSRSALLCQAASQRFGRRKQLAGGRFSASRCSVQGARQTTEYQDVTKSGNQLAVQDAPRLANVNASRHVSGNPSRLPAVAKIVVLDIAGPLGLYVWLRSQGWSMVTSLVVSGVLPAVGVILGIARTRRIDVIGVVVLLGIAAGTTLGLVSGSARLLLLEGSVPTAIFGAVCLASLRTSRPLMFRFAVEFMGEDTPRGRGFADNWRYPGFRHAFKVVTTVWGVAYLLEAAARVAIVETTSTGTALGISKVMPYAIAGVLAAWNVAYGRQARRKGERLGAEAMRVTKLPPKPTLDRD
jgi:hypothetical protein